ncbi:MAG: flagellar basal body rod protein FlgC [bacterium]
MGLNDAMDISVSGIKANRLHMEIIASNVANMTSTRSMDGGPYRRKIPVFSESSANFSRVYQGALNKQVGGVAITDIISDPSPPSRVFNPSHPDADSQGYVSLPNVSYSQEMTDMMFSTRLYEANITVFNATKKMAQDTLQIQ